MSHESTITELKKLTKYDLLAVDPQVHARHILDESDRTSIILNAAVIEDMVVRELLKRMPTINSDERDRLFNFEGPCGSFANRIRMAQALGIIDRPMRKRIEIIKEMRNAAAHSHLPLDFGVPEIKEATAALLPPEARDEFRAWSRRRVRAAYTTLTMKIAVHLSGGEELEVTAFWEWLRGQKMKPPTSRGKLSGASRRSHPRRARRDKRP